MTTRKTVSGLNVEIKTEQREGYFAARTNPFALTVYAKTEHEVEERAIKAIGILFRYSPMTFNKVRNGVSKHTSPA